LRENKKNIFSEYGFDWCGHQKYTEFVVHLKDGSTATKKGRKLAVFQTVEDAMDAAKVYGANSVVLQDDGFSLRWGCRVHKNPQEKTDEDKDFKYTGMGCWVARRINANQIINNIGYTVNGESRWAFKISDGLKKHIRAATKCGQNIMAGTYTNHMSYYKGTAGFNQRYEAPAAEVSSLEKINVADIASGEDAAGEEFDDKCCDICLEDMVEEKLQVIKCHSCHKLCCESCRVRMDGCGTCRAGDTYSGYSRVRLFNKVATQRRSPNGRMMIINRCVFVRDEYN